MTGTAASKALSLVHEAAHQEVRRVGQLAGVGVDDGQHRDDALLGEGTAVLRCASVTPPTVCASTYTLPAGDLAGDLGVPVDQVDDHAVLGDDHVVRRRRRWLIARSALAWRWRHSPWTGITLRRLDDVVAVDELAGAGVPGDVHLGVALVHDVGAPAGEAVDHGRRWRSRCRGSPSWPSGWCRPRRRGSCGRGSPSGTAPPSARPASRCRSAWPCWPAASRAARAGRSRPCGHLEVAEVLGDAHVADHRAADEGDLAAVRVGGVQHLLDAVHVAGEAGDDDPPRRGAEDRLDGRAPGRARRW